MKTVFRYSFLLLCAAMACVSCRHRNTPTPPVEAPSWQVEENLQGPILWQVADDAVDITSRMYLIASLGDSVAEQDKLAAYCDGECVSVVEPVSTPDGWLFYMIINRPHASETEAITLAYYYSVNGKVAYWPELFLFEHDGLLGSADEPFSPSASMRRSYPMVLNVAASLPANIHPAEGDEMAVFVENHCRAVINPLEKNGTHGFDYSFELPLNQPVETIEIRYFSREAGDIYVASGIEANKKDVILLLNPIPFK